MTNKVFIPLIIRRVGSRRLLDGGEDATANGRREAETDEEACGVEVVLPRLVDHPQLMVRCGIPVGENLIDLAPFQGHFIALVPEAQHQLRSRGGHISQDNV